MSSNISIRTNKPINLNESGEGAGVNGFQMSPNGLSASKTILLHLEDGTSRNYTFKIVFKDPNLSSATLKKYTDQKLQTLGKMSVELGCGIKYDSLKFKNNDQNSSLELKKKDGSVKTIDQAYINSKQDTKMSVRLFKTLDCVSRNQYFGINHKFEVIKSTDEMEAFREKRITLIKKLQESTKERFIDGIKVSIYYEYFFENIKKAPDDLIEQFIKDAQRFVK